MRRSWVVLAAGMLAACDGDTTAVDSLIQAGVLQISGWTGFVAVPTGTASDTRVVWDRPPAAADVVPPRVIEAPDTVASGVGFDVTTYTVAPSGCWRAADQQVAIIGRVVQLRPYDQHSGAPICTGVLLFPAHTSRIVLNEPGAWTLRVIGRRAKPDGQSIELMIKAEKTIVVR